MSTEQYDALRESGVKEAVAEALQTAGKAWKMAAICRASLNPEMASLVPHYEAIAEVWERHSVRLMQANPKLPPSA